MVQLPHTCAMSVSDGPGPALMMFRKLLVLSTGLTLAACAALQRQSPQASCAAIEPDDASEPLYAEARDVLTSPGWAELRAENALRGLATDVSWLSDRAVCAQIRRTLRQTVDDPPLAAVRAGNFILVHVRPQGTRYIFDLTGKLLAILGVPG
jgi:hypothetical protein